ncbi:MAG TPA: alkaline phosphatase PhoX [Gemmatimonadaceae bacterium]|nr:alkaline phosphatase PhoX [Gemmatimonadaceae bacterium]
MAVRLQWRHTLGAVCATGTLIAAACSDTVNNPSGANAPQLQRVGVASGPFQFEPLASSAVCTQAGGNPVAPLVLPPGYSQVQIAAEDGVNYLDDADMHTQNETGPEAGRYLYRAHEIGGVGGVSVTDTRTGETKVFARRVDWERLDPATWTPWGTILIGEETNAATFRDPNVPQAQAGLVYELFPNQNDPSVLDSAVARPAIGAKSHEGMRFDPQGNLYSISEAFSGAIFKFVPDRHGDLSSGQTYVLRVTEPVGDRTGPAEWVPLDRASVQVNANAAATAAGATGYDRPEDVEIATSTGNSRDGSNTLYVAVTSGPRDNRVIAIDLREPKGGSDHSTAYVYDYVRVGLNTTTEFEMPDNLALDRAGNLYIAEDPGGSFRNGAGKTKGDDIWVATPNPGRPHQPAKSVVRFASINDCDAEPTGIYFEHTGDRLFVNIQHRGGDRQDKSMAILRPQD